MFQSKTEADSTIQIHLLDKNNVECVNTLFNDVFNKNRSLAEWNWKFCEFKNSIPLIVVATLENKVIGSYCAQLSTASFLGRNTPVAHIVDTCVHPVFQRKGVFQSMYHQMCSCLIERNIPFAFGFPGKEAFEIGTSKLAYKNVSRIPAWLLRQTHNIQIKRDPSLFCSISANPPDDIENLFANSSLRLSIATVRDYKFWRWRFREKPNSDNIFLSCRDTDNTLLAAAVLRIANQSGKLFCIIQDILSIPNKHVFYSLMASLIDYSKKMGANRIYCWLLDNGQLSEVFSSLGFKKITRGQPWLVTQMMAQNHDTSFEKKLYSKENWFITLADTDL